MDGLLMLIVLKMCKGDVIQKKKRKGERDACWDTRAGGLSVSETYLDIKRPDCVILVLIRSQLDTCVDLY